MGKDKDERTQRREFLKVAATGAASAAAVGAFSVSSAVAESGAKSESEIPFFNVRRFGARGDGTTTDTPKTDRPGVGNKAIALKNCRNVILRDFSMLAAGWFAILATGVDNLTLDNLKIDTNRDGIDIDCCRNVRVSNCSVNSPWDDAICLKSSFALGYARATEMVTISNCLLAGSFQEGCLLDGTWKKFPAEEKVQR